jgi:RND family efflux transporter MFP subunit
MSRAFTRTHFVTTLLFALALSACSGEDKAKQAQTRQNVVQVQMTVLQPVATVATAAAPGTVIALESVQVASRLMGYLRDFAVVEGQAVKKGQRLFTIDPLDIEGAVEQAGLSVQQAEAAQKDAKADYDRFDALYKDEVVTRQQYEKMKLNYEMAASRAAQARSGLGTARGQMRYATVTAPIDGVVTRKLASQGDIAAPGHPVLMLENPARLQVQTSVAEDIYKGLRLGQEVQVEVDGRAQPLTARVARLSPAADPMTHAYMVKLDIACKLPSPRGGGAGGEGSCGLTSGAFARVLFPTAKREVLALTRAAVLNRAGIAGVFVVAADGTAQYRMVRLGQESSGMVEVLSGLNPGDRVVTGNAAAVNNGDKVSG